MESFSSTQFTKKGKENHFVATEERDEYSTVISMSSR